MCLVYLREAHACDEWPLGGHGGHIPQPRSLDERLALAARLEEKAELPVWVDGMDDAFLTAFKAHPLRYFVFHQARCVTAAQPYHDYPRFQAGFDLRVVRRALDRLEGGELAAPAEHAAGDWA